MQQAIQTLIQQVFGALSNVSPIAKAVSVSATALVSALINMAFAGSFDTTSIVVLAVGVISTLVVYFVPNKPKPAAAATK